MDIGLFVLAASSLLCLAVIARAPISRLEALRLALVVFSVGCTASAILLTAAVVGVGPDPGGIIVVVVVAAVLVVVAVFAGGLFAITLRRARTLPAASQRQRLYTEAAGILLLVVAVVIGLVDLFDQGARGDAAGPGAGWAAIVGAAIACGTAARAGAMPTAARDLAIVVVATAMFLIALPLPLVPVAFAAVVVAVVLGGTVDLRRTAAAPASLTADATHDAVISVQPGIAGFAPLLDDAHQRRPQRPRIFSRAGARRLIDVAIDRAWRAQPAGRGRAPVDISGGDDIDIDGDAGELAEALCAIVDNALREQSRHSDRRIAVVIRATAHTVAFEIDDGSAPALVGEWRPFLVSGVVDVERPGYGVALARARLLLERHGGQLSLGRGAGAVVHVTLPRRLQRPAAVVA